MQIRSLPSHPEKPKGLHHDHLYTITNSIKGIHSYTHSYKATVTIDREWISPGRTDHDREGPRRHARVEGNEIGGSVSGLLTMGPAAGHRRQLPGAPLALLEAVEVVVIHAPRKMS